MIRHSNWNSFSHFPPYLLPTLLFRGNSSISRNFGTTADNLLYKRIGISFYTLILRKQQIGFRTSVETSIPSDLGRLIPVLLRSRYERKPQFTILITVFLPIPSTTVTLHARASREEERNREQRKRNEVPSDCWVCLVITSITYLLLAMSDIDSMPHHDIAQLPARSTLGNNSKSRSSRIGRKQSP